MSRTATRRSTSNGNSAGNSEDRRRRREWVWRKFSKNGRIRCRWCPRRMKKSEFQIDRHPVCGHDGGRYVRDNIVPACVKCNAGRCSRTCNLAARRKKVA